MITPIHRIPLENHTEMELINAENRDHPETGDAIAELLDITSGNHMDITLDWAMQLRDRTGMDWGTCLSVAMTLYLG